MNWWVRQLPVFAILTAVPWAARHDNPYAMFALWAVIGTALCWMLTRRWMVSRSALPLLWASVAAVSALIRYVDSRSGWSWGPDAVAWVWFVSVAATIVASWWWLWKMAARYTHHEVPATDAAFSDELDPDSYPHILVSRGLATGVAAAAAAIVVQTSVTTNAFTPPESSGMWLWGLAFGAVAGVVAAITALALWRSRDTVSRDVKPLIRAKRAPTPFTFAEKYRETAAADGHTSFLEGVTIAVTSLAQSIARLVQVAAYAAVRFTIATTNKIWEKVVITLRHAAATMRYVGRTLVAALPAVAALAYRFARGIAIPVAATVAAAYLMWASADRITQYLHDAGVGMLPVGIGAGVGAILAAAAAWAAVTGAEWRDSWMSFVTFVEQRGGTAVLLVVVGGWVGALAGYAGFGPMRLGPVTLVGSAGVAALVAWMIFAPSRANQPAASLVAAPETGSHGPPPDAAPPAGAGQHA